MIKFIKALFDFIRNYNSEEVEILHGSISEEIKRIEREDDLKKNELYKLQYAAYYKAVDGEVPWHLKYTEKIYEVTNINPYIIKELNKGIGEGYKMLNSNFDMNEINYIIKNKLYIGSIFTSLDVINYIKKINEEGLMTNLNS